MPGETFRRLFVSLLLVCMASCSLTGQKVSIVGMQDDLKSTKAIL